MLRRTSTMIAIAITTVVPSEALAQAFPSKPLRIIVPFAAGGAADITSRMLGEHLSKALGQSVIVDNRPGAGAVIGYELGARAPADGHTLLIVFPSFVINPSVRRVQYDPINDFKAVTQVSSLPMTFTVHPSLPARTMKELIALARAKPGEISYGTPGVGTIQHVLGELFRLTMKVNVVHVPYSGLAPAMTAIAGGHIVTVIGNVVEVAPFAKSGKVRPIVVTTASRTDALPDVPTVKEAGYPELEATNWAGYVVPAATPPAAIARLNTELGRILRTPDIQEKFRVQGQSALPGTPEQFAALLQSESARYSKVVRAANIKAE
ncbi:MAG TPA: tripartite tricarboxylate transporter substrate binding protein [Burkholderiales bacterium]|nr:tripartite tricarboxylate transporter substrate binding protein [Burkholderiales bacterium]